MAMDAVTKRTRRSWDMMKQRCGNPNNTNYRKYGARGISYDPEWKPFAKFLADMGQRPEGMSLDRIDTLGNYCKENCRWADKYQQAENQRTRAGTGSGHKNVYWAETGKKWVVKIRRRGVKHYIGVFADINNAVYARDMFLKSIKMEA